MGVCTPNIQLPDSFLYEASKLNLSLVRPYFNLATPWPSKQIFLGKGLTREVRSKLEQDTNEKIKVKNSMLEQATLRSTMKQGAFLKFSLALILKYPLFLIVFRNFLRPRQSISELLHHFLALDK